MIFSDVSEPLLDDCRGIAADAELLDRCELVLASADDLGTIADGSADVVVTRSVLIFVRDKRAALREFHRILRTGGRISLFEPISAYFGRGRRSWAWNTTGVADLVEKIDAVFERHQPHDDPMLDFDERDLFSLVLDAGFREAHMELHVHVRPMPPLSWDAMSNRAANPKAPTLR